MRVIRTLLFFALTCVLVACEKAILTDEESVSTPSHANLTLSIHQLEQTPFSSLLRSSVSEVCTHLNYAVYDLEGNRIKQVNQKLGDSDYGIATFDLPTGDYQLVVIAHSSNTNPTMTNPAKIQFSNSQGYTDTFLSYTIVSIGDAPQNLTLSLRRIVALCRFVISDVIPEGVSRLEFTYKGGSGHFDARTGLGVTNSTQVVKYDVQAGKSQTQYNLYTFLHNTEDTIHLKVSAYGTATAPQYEQEFDIPMEQNKITWLTGDFFTTTSPATSQTVTNIVIINNVWDGEQYLTY